MKRLRRKWRCWHHQHDDGPILVVNNPPWYDEEGHWRPPVQLKKCRYCGRSWDPLFPPSSGPIAS